MSEKIPKGWKWVKLGEVVTLQRGYDLPKTKMKKGDIPVVGSNGIIGYHNKATTKAPGITIGRSGNIGNAYLHKSDFWAHNTTLYVKDFKGNDVIFLFYLFKNIDFNQLNAGSAVPTLNRNHIYPIEVKIPIRIEDQKAIAEVLSSIDDKIDLLHRQNKTLEEMAMALFRQWFIEPTKDGLPEGWEEKALDEIAEFLNGIPSQKYHGDKLPVIKIKEMREGITESSDYCNNNVPEKYLVNSGDILFSWSGSLEVVIWFGSIGVLNQHIFKVTSLEYPKWFCYLSIKQHIEEFRAIAESKTTTMGHIQREHLSNTKVFIPPKIFFENYNKTMTPIFDKIIANNAEIQTLDKLRDTLLPKLMSRELRVKV